MPDDDPIIIAFCLGLTIGVGLAMAIVVWKIRHLRRTPPPPPINQPIAILHPLAALKAVSKHQWQNGKPLFNSSWKS